MACIKNPKKLLFIKYNGSHNASLTHIRRYGERCWAKYECDFKCKLCGVNLGYSIIREENLVEDGYDVKKLQKISGFDMFSKNAEDLK